MFFENRICETRVPTQNRVSQTRFMLDLDLKKKKKEELEYTKLEFHALKKK